MRPNCKPSGLNAIRVLSGADFTPQLPSDVTLEALTALSEAGTTAGVEIAAARNSVRACLDRQASDAARYLRAEDLGTQVADAVLGGAR